MAEAWRVNRAEPVVVRLHLSLSQYLDGPSELHHILKTLLTLSMDQCDS